MKDKPIIGITFDIQQPGHYSSYPWYALRENYCSSVAEAGGIPLPLTHELNLVDSYIELIDGLLITGGDFDLDPTLYGEESQHETVKVKPTRTNFELAITHSALKKNIPVFGICGGQQLINVALGGTLIQHIPDEIENPLEHSQKHPASQPAHKVTIVKNTFLQKLINLESIDVNSSHHQAVKTLGKDAVLNAIAPDGVIEGFEVPQYKFCLGLQWHPEFHVTPQDRLIIEAFVNASRK
jgi:putative glutamine amidotransferase